MGSTRSLFRSYPLRVPPASLFFAKVMGPILVFFRIFFFSPPGAAQTGLEAELRNLEDRISRPASVAARLEDLGRLALLRELSGDLEGAASSWELASGGGRNWGALLRAAACFMAQGEWERAEAAVTESLLGSGTGEERLQAAFLRAQMEGLRSGGTNSSALALLLEDPAYGAWGPRICFSLWKLTGREDWRRKLAEEFPRSPEGRIAAGGAGGMVLMAEPSPMWLLFAAGVPSASQHFPAVPPPAVQQPTAPQPADSRQSPGSPPPPVSSRSPPSPSPQPLPGETLLQAGLFSREANARLLLEQLRAAGFPALSGGQTRAGTDYTAVYVRPGPDINQSIRDLKAAGFESFPTAPGGQ